MIVIPTSHLSDTSPEIGRLQLALMHSAPAWRKLELAGQMFESMKLLALVGLRQRHPLANEQELRRRLTDLLLGPQLASRAYGPLIITRDDLAA